MAEKRNSSGEEFVITRVFDAPRSLMWRVWTECDHLKHWWGPKGFQVRVCKNDLRTGGLLHYCLQSPEGLEIWGKFAYREVVPPERLVFINSFSDESGATARHPLNQAWPLEILSTITFDEKDGGTAVTVHWVPFEATEEERRTFAEGRASMQQGWGGTMEQLAGYLAKARKEE